MKKAISVVFLLFCITSVYAGQKVAVSLTNDLADDSAIQSTSFSSTDYFEGYTYNRLKQGTVSRTYYHGPKTIWFEIAVNKDRFFNTDFSGCRHIQICDYDDNAYTCYGYQMDTASDHMNINIREADGKISCFIDQ